MCDAFPGNVTRKPQTAVDIKTAGLKRIVLQLSTCELQYVATYRFAPAINTKSGLVDLSSKNDFF